MTTLQRAEEIATDYVNGVLSRREALRRLAVLGVGAAAAPALIAGCADDAENKPAADAPEGAPQGSATSKLATDATKAANQAVLDSLPFADRADFEDAQRDLIARPDTLTIKNANGDVVWDLVVCPVIN